MGARAGILLLVLGSFGCGTAATARSVEGKTSAYEIECVLAANCVAKAREVCGERFHVVSRWERPMALPDARPDTRPGARDYPHQFAQRVAEWETHSSMTGPSDVATAPPLRGLDVVCVN
jgi:hypothetical protein